MANLKLEKVNKIYDNGFQAVFDFTMDIKDREFIVFVGPSGCGKSTMLRTIAGLEDISRGKIYIDGELVNNKTPRERGIAMIFQSYALYPHMNVFENMAFALTLEGYDEDFIEKRVKETAAILGLENYLNRKPRELSGGQCQRVAVGRAIIRHPKVFLMDEPLSNLDAKQRASMRTEIIEIHRKTKATTIYVTHDQTEAMTMADRIVVMRDGYIQQIGTPYELYFRPYNRFVAGFIGEPPMNFLPCKIEKGKAIFENSNITFDISKDFPKLAKEYEGKEVILGFRPEAVELVSQGAKASDGYVLSSRVELTELLGDSVNAYVTLCNSRLILRVPPYNAPEYNSLCTFKLSKEKIYWFDVESTKAVYED